MRLLICDDEELIRDLIKDYADLEGFKCDLACDGSEALEKVEENKYDLIVMDIMMPNMDGYTALKGIREICDTPVIMLSARVDEVDKLKGFDLGIDDYVTKPFSPKELIARIKAHTKRTIGGETLSAGNIVLDNKAHILTIDGEEVDITSTQYELLVLFLKNQGIALSREKIIENVFGYEYEADDRTIDAHIKLLRKKLGKYSNSIKTIRKVGYKFIYED